MKGNGKQVISVALIIIFLDQFTKLFAIQITQSYPIINKVLHFTLAKNYGAGFSILQHQRFFFIIFSLLIIGIIIYYLKNIPNTRYVIFSVGFVLGGAIGNLIDRIRFGYVIDFIDLQVWPIFNIADSAITLGAIGLVIFFWKN